MDQDSHQCQSPAVSPLREKHCAYPRKLRGNNSDEIWRGQCRSKHQLIVQILYSKWSMPQDYKMQKFYFKDIHVIKPLDSLYPLPNVCVYFCEDKMKADKRRAPSILYMASCCYSDGNWHLLPMMLMENDWSYDPEHSSMQPEFSCSRFPPQLLFFLLIHSTSVSFMNDSLIPLEIAISY